MTKALTRKALSIKNQLMLVASVAVGFSLFIVLILFVYLNSENEWSKLSTRLAIQAKIIAKNSVTAIVFDDPYTAEEILAALVADESIIKAKIMRNKQTVFARYDSPNAHKNIPTRDSFFSLSKWLAMHILIEDDIYHNKLKIGSVHITASLRALYHNNMQYIYIAFLISLISMFLTVLLLNFLLKPITDPVLKLTGTAKKITNASNYSVRAEVLSDNEIGELTQSFNEMLDEIQRKDHVLEQTVTERTAELIQLNNKLRHQATHDTLTGLANRLLFDDRLQLVLTHALRTGAKVAVMYFDLDYFKVINDTLGHDTGDELLIAVTQRMKSVVREDDTLCRIGGDEFTLILSSIESPADVELVAQKMLAAFSEPFICNGHELAISSSIGISLYPENSKSKEQLKQFADIAMYHSKYSGRNQYCFFMQQMHRENVQNMDNRVLLKRQLKTAFDNDDLQIYYQPQVNMQRQIIAVEALLRWRNIKNEMISPEVFIPLSVESGLIQELEEWAFAEVCQHYADWLAGGLPEIKVSLNISGYRLRQHNLIQFIEKSMERFALTPDFLIFEISENEIMQNINETEKVLNKLHDKGIQLAVDNFGTGYTSLNYLQKLPIDVFKIDSSFVWQLGNQYDESPIVQAIIGLADSLNKSVVAMGVEQEKQAKYLDGLNCQAMQGYLFGKPVPEADVRKMLHGFIHETTKDIF